MKQSLLLLVLGIAMPAHASDPESWQFVYVSRSSDLQVTSGQAVLARSGNRLTGKLTGEHDVQFSIDAVITGNKVTATFGSLESDDGGIRLTMARSVSQLCRALVVVAAGKRSSYRTGSALWRSHVTRPGVSPNNSFKPKPLRGSA